MARSLLYRDPMTHPPPRILSLFGLGIVLGLGLALPACFDGSNGDRADDDGACPTERCSPTTPRGLTFNTRGLGGAGGGVLPVAIGGRIDLTLRDVATGALLGVPYRASTNGRFTVLGQQGPLVSLRALDARAPSDAPPSSGLFDLLRITEIDSVTLFDQIELTAVPLASIEARGQQHARISSALLPRRPISLWAGATGIALELALFAADGRRLIDEALALRRSDGPLGTVVTRGSSWDLLAVTTPLAGVLELQLSAGGANLPSLSLPIVSTIDGFEHSPAPAEMLVGGFYVHCVNALHGERAIIGVPWAFSATGGAIVTSLGTSCVLFNPTREGAASVTATVATPAGNRADVTSFTVRPRPPSASLLERPAAQPSTGQRLGQSLGQSLGQRAEAAFGYVSSPVQ
jgi:hypothetical protein